MGIFKELSEEKSYVEDHSDDLIGLGWLVNKSKENLQLKEKHSNNIWVAGPNKVLKNVILQAINNAKNVICVCSFLFADDDLENALVNAFDRGIRVYLLTARDEILESQSEDLREFDLRVKEKHITILKNFSGKILVRKSSHFHSKFLLVDPNSEQTRRGFLLTANLTQKALEVNPEICIELDKTSSLGLFLQFKQGFWNESERELVEDELIPIVSLNLIVPQMDKILSTSMVSSSLKDNLLSLIESTSGEIIISTFGIRDDCDVTKAIFSAAKNSRKITIITQTRLATSEILNRLRKLGVNIIGHKDVHAKAILVKENNGFIGILMTANFSSLGLDSGFETGIKLEGKNAEIIMSILNEWIRKFPATFKEIKVKDIDADNKLFQDRNGKNIILQNDILKTNIEIESKFAENLGNIHASTIEEIPNLKPKEFPKPTNKNKFFKEYEYKWIITPPYLPPKASEAVDINDRKKKGFKLFWDKKQLYLLLEQLKDKSKAKRVAKDLNAKVVVKKE